MSLEKCMDCGSSFNREFESECLICAQRSQRLAQAQNPGTSPDDLGKLALDSHPPIAAAAVANPNTPQWAKNRASRDDSTEVPRMASHGGNSPVNGPHPYQDFVATRSMEQVLQKTLREATSEQKEHLRGIHLWVSFLGIVVAVNLVATFLQWWLAL